MVKKCDYTTECSFLCHDELVLSNYNISKIDKFNIRVRHHSLLNTYVRNVNGTYQISKSENKADHIIGHDFTLMDSKTHHFTYNNEKYEIAEAAVIKEEKSVFAKYHLLTDIASTFITFYNQATDKLNEKSTLKGNKKSSIEYSDVSTDKYKEIFTSRLFGSKEFFCFYFNSFKYSHR